MSSAVIVSVRVKASPARAFDVFTQEIALWWRPNPLFQLTPHGDGVLRFEGAAGGRLIAAFPGVRNWAGDRLGSWRTAGVLVASRDLSSRAEHAGERVF
ncbi:MAG: hypothetical protein ABL883_05950 [Terricaulis sp.]